MADLCECAHFLLHWFPFSLASYQFEDIKELRGALKSELPYGHVSDSVSLHNYTCEKASAKQGGAGEGITIVSGG